MRGKASQGSVFMASIISCTSNSTESSSCTLHCKAMRCSWNGERESCKIENKVTQVSKGKQQLS